MTEDEKRIEMARVLLPHSTVVVPTSGLYYHVQRLIEEIRGAQFRRETRVVTVNQRGHADKLRGLDRIFFDPACDGDLGSNVAMAEMRKARDMARALNRLESPLAWAISPATDIVLGYETDAERAAFVPLNWGG